MLFGNEHVQPCKHCRKVLCFDEATVDHVVPRSKGGSNRIENLAISCLECNQRHGDKMKVEGFYVQTKHDSDYNYDLYTFVIDGVRYNYDVDYRQVETWLYIQSVPDGKSKRQDRRSIMIPAIVKMNEADPAETIERIRKLALLV